MSDRDDFKRTIVYGENAVGHLRKNEIPAYPRNYELWYTYAAGFNHALNKSINDVIRARGKISPNELDRVYEQYIAPTRIGERIDEVGGRLSQEINGVAGLIETQMASTSIYSSSLGDAKTALAGAKDAVAIESIVSGLMSATHETERVNHQLERQLTESRRQIAELQESLEAIRYESLVDDLTTLANRKHFDQSLDRILAETDQSETPFSLLFTDIDHFKKFNDTFGHQTGDQVLRLVALAVKQNIKGQDIAFRYGGEEFAVILPRTALEQSVVVAEHIREAVFSKELVKRSTGENLGRITISIGVSEWRPGDTAQSIIERADTCLYAAKNGGRNQVRWTVETPTNEHGSKVA
ncbi:GGDEF domain-containing protein [Pinisolibacter aquiterrae]|uniref:GGDEF domain-containing protein n=1 Tax=Pinisolibacter aquiterrae TaxID=2815579 RepID=UPI001C3D35E2|nr:GGDEF domain-containing protein [Pinisolibacter aquiterrae]MBV5263958.1 GGDEF domain-containing protein [Pinisolibacter aquiterrae]MCC8235969.1 GGDEF domain-containing protein [Pinisolibacter aquiterrae]